MSLPTILSFVALAASILLLVSAQARVPAAAALLASALEMLIRLRIVRLSVAHISISLLLGAVLLTAAVFVYVKASTKATISAATLAALVGAIQVLRELHVF